MDVTVPALGTWKPSRSVSVVVPHYESHEALALTLAALRQQSYPRSLFEVIVVDDGSGQPPRLSVPELSARLIVQEHRGFGAPRARNAGVAAADGEIVLFLDCDMMPEPWWLEAHARWHHEVSDAVTLGFRVHVESDGVSPESIREVAGGDGLAGLFAGREQQRPEWIEWHMSRTEMLTTSHDDLFRVVTSGNLGMRHETFLEAGGFDESFDQWGAEDTEFGYRLFVNGSLLVPDREALCWHQGLMGASPDSDEQRSLIEQRAKIANLIADHGFRRAVPGRSYRVPYVVVNIDIGYESAEHVQDLVESVLANRFHDLVVRLVIDGEHPERVWLQRQFGDDPRIIMPDGASVQAERHLRFAPITIELSPLVRLAETSIETIVNRMTPDGVAVLSVDAPGFALPPLRAAKTRALRRAERSLDSRDPWGLAAELFDHQRLAPRAVGVLRASRLRAAVKVVVCSGPQRRVVRPDVWIAAKRNARKVWRRLWSIRSFPQLVSVVRWLTEGVRWRVEKKVRASRRSIGKTARDLGGSPPQSTGASATDSSGTASPIQRIPFEPAEATGRPEADSRDFVKLGLRVGFFGERANLLFARGIDGIVLDGIPRQRLGERLQSLDVVLIDGEDERAPRSLTQELVVDSYRSGTRLVSLGAPPDRLGEHVEAALLDHGRTEGDGCSSLVPPLDLAVVNPIGFRHDAMQKLAVVGVGNATERALNEAQERCPGLVPEAVSLEVPDELRSPKHLTVALRQPRMLRQLIDSLRQHRAAFLPASSFPDDFSRVTLVAALCGAGIPVVVDPGASSLRRALGESPSVAISRLGRSDLADPHERERMSTRVRRAVLRDHSVEQRWRQLAAELGISLLQPPSLTVTLATNRPASLEHVVEQINRQSYQPRETVIVLHGDGFDSSVARWLEEVLEGPVAVETVPGRATLGDALNRAVDAASGDVLVKFDDDDWYGSDHLWDLALALQYSGADLVGKGAEFVYLAGRDRTIRRLADRGETWSQTIGGGTLAIGRDRLRSLGGWKRVKRSVDRELIHTVLESGGRVFRTHGFGYVLHRHGDSHTWATDDDYFLRQADASRPGLALDFADIDGS